MIMGIDLGTTNSTVSLSQESNIVPFLIPQQLDRHMRGDLPMLPSFLFYSPEGERFIGAYARDRGADLPDRVIHSAKSWLCHRNLDRHAACLPEGDCEKKMSPVSVCEAYLSHIKQAWEARYGTLQDTPLVVTVPASFDPSARQLVEEACDRAQLPPRLLIEEPLAAFYAWLFDHKDTWRQLLKVGDTVLVVDIGGGTTDFSLIRVEEREGEIALARVAVGEHLLLGGDNMDLALAYHLQAKHTLHLDDWQMRSLVHSCRTAKETLLSPEAPESLDLIIPGRGSSIIGGMLTVTLTQQELQELLIEGFFPLVDAATSPKTFPRMGLAQDTLNYVKDPRITAHLAQFLSEHPTAVLFNGGVMHAVPLRQRLLKQLELWKGSPVLELSDADYDFAVSRGAVYYGMVQAGEGIRIRAPLAKSYFIGVERPAPAVPGMPPLVIGVCVVPQGMEEGTEVTLPTSFTLAIGEPVAFRFFVNSDAMTLGTTQPLDQLTELRPLETTLDAEGAGIVTVQLRAKVTELGVLELWCMSEQGQWKLEFDVRAQDGLSLVSS